MSSETKEPIPRAREIATVGADLGRYAGLGLQFAATIAVFAFAGYWLDRWLGAFPIFLMVGVLIGFGGGILAIIKKVPPPRGGSGRTPQSPSQP